jgi:hypothetical protein
MAFTFGVNSRMAGAVKKQPLFEQGNIDALMADPDAGAYLQKENIKSRDADNAVKQRRLTGDLKAGNFGTGLVSGVNKALNGAGKQGLPEGGIASLLLQNAGDIGGGLLRAAGLGKSANNAAEQAGVMADAQNDQIRNQLIENAKREAEGMNASNAAAAAGMADSANAAAFSAERQQAAIADSGIEGSSNMGRNVEYGLDREEAQARLQYDMMAQGARDMSGRLANSFSELSQNKAGAMRGAWNNAVSSFGQNLTNEYIAQGEYAMENQTTMADDQKALMEANALADQKGLDDYKKKKRNPIAEQEDNLSWMS